MALEDFDGIPVDTELVSLDSWDGCGWLYPDGHVVATNYAGHHNHTYLLTREPTYDSILDQYHLVHVGGDIYASKRPTKAQREHLNLLAGHFSRVSDALEKQGYKVEHHYQSGVEWSV